MRVIACPKKPQEQLAEEPMSTSETDCNYRAQSFAHIDDAPSLDLGLLIPPDKQFFSKSYLAGIESAQPEMSFRYSLFYRNEQAVAFAYFQVLPFEGEKIKDYGKIEAKGKRSISQRLKDMSGVAVKKFSERVKGKILVCGNAFMTGENGFYHSNSIDSTTAYALLMDELNKIEKEIRPFATICKDYYPTDTHPQQVFTEAAFHQFLVEPNMLLALPTEWNSYEAYLAAMSSKYRQRAKSAYKKSKTIECRELSVDFIRSHNDQMYKMFDHVVKQASFSMEEAGLNYFLELKEALAEDILFLGYFLEDEFVGFITLIHNGDVLESHYLGYDTSLNRSHKLYQRMLYDMVKQGIELEKAQIAFARTALEIKSTVGAMPCDMNCYLRLRNRFFNRLISPVMRNIKMPEWEQRHPFKEGEEPRINLPISS